MTFIYVDIVPLFNSPYNRLFNAPPRQEARQMVAAFFTITYGKMQTIRSDPTDDPTDKTRSGVGRGNRRPGENDMRGVSEWREI